LINKPEDRHFNEVEDLGVAIRTVQGQQQLHIGLLYKTEESEALILNLRTHLDLRNEAPTDHYRWIQISLDEINRRTLVGLCRLIANKCKSIPFGFTYNGLYFTKAGEYIPHDLGHGLTCSTFVMAVFATYSFPILKVEEWRTRLEDQGWQTGQVRIIQIRHGNFIAGAVAEHVGEPRFRPEEVTAGAISSDRPLGFNDADALGRRIRTDLLRSYNH
jgi:hypothetical protein